MRDLLSYGSATEEIALQPLNVLIGANASGKSNLIEAISLLQATPADLTLPIRQGGGVSDWLWKGGGSTPTAEINTTVVTPFGSQPLRYRLAFTMVGQRLELVDEAIEHAQPSPPHPDPYFYYCYQHGRPALNVRTQIDAPAGTEDGRTQRILRQEDLNLEQSILSQRKDPDQYPELTYIAGQFGAIRLYREWELGRFTALRLPQKPDLPGDFLLEDASNLGVVLNSLEHHNGAKQPLIEMLQRFYEGVTDITTRIQGGTVQIFLHERGLRQPVPATRLSDGTLR